MDYDDLISEGYVGYLMALRDYDPTKSSLCTWAYLKMRGRILNHLHRKGPKDATTAEIEPTGDHLDYDDRVALRTALASLPERLQEVLRMHYFEGKSYSEIGQQIGKCKGTVEWLHLKALGYLRRLMT